MSVRGILKDITSLKGLGAFKDQNKVRLYYLSQNNQLQINISQSSDGLNFPESKDKLILYDSRGRNVRLNNLETIRISRHNGEYVMVYRVKKGLVSSLFTARSKESVNFRTIGRVPQISDTAQIVSDFKHHDNFVMFAGGRDIRILTSKDLVKWKMQRKAVLLSASGNGHYEIGAIEKIANGISVLFFQKFISGDGKSYYSIHAAIFDQNNPEKLIFKTEDSLWEQPGEWSHLEINIQPFGLITQGSRLISYWDLNGREILSIVHDQVKRVYTEEKSLSPVLLKKIRENPILKPIADHFWESKATFNPAAIYDEGKVHIVYRAIGDHDMSMLGYASSKDGINIDERLDEPIYVPTEPFEFQNADTGKPIPLSPYASGGGGYGGVEDPRITRIGKKFYMTYVAYDGSNPPRVALTSIKVSDFRNKKWNWKRPVLISAPNVVNKNAVIFPEKINGKYVIMHRVFPNILIDFVDHLDFDGSQFLRGDFMIRPRISSWDSRKVGVGAPPIKTDKGWLIIYHAVGDDDPGRYKMGAMLLDLSDPTRIIARSAKPILEPEEYYENEGFKYGVAYPCGAVTLDNTLMVYYGGADMVTCVATAELSTLLNNLLDHSEGELHKLNIPL